MSKHKPKKSRWRVNRRNILLKELRNESGRIVARFWLRRGELCWRVYDSRRESGDWERAAAALLELTTLTHEVAYRVMFRRGCDFSPSR